MRKTTAMCLDLSELSQKVATHGRVARVVVAAVQGSTPRDQGAAMLVWQQGQCGTIGGGALEYQAVEAARAALCSCDTWSRSLRRVPLGPALGQCCGGSVSLLTEVFGAAECEYLETLAQNVAAIARPVTSGVPPRAGSAPGFSQAQFSETLAAARRSIWIYGAGHVGRALVDLLPQLGYDVTWIDTDSARFPEGEAPHVSRLIAKDPAEVVRYAPHDARHLILTYSHALDLEICHRILGHGFRSAGLIGSATKWARFQTRLAKLGHSPAQIARIDCPIGLPELGKSPVAIALGVACVLQRQAVSSAAGQPLAI